MQETLGFYVLSVLIHNLLSIFVHKICYPLSYTGVVISFHVRNYINQYNFEEYVIYFHVILSVLSAEMSQSSILISLKISPRMP